MKKCSILFGILLAVFSLIFYQSCEIEEDDKPDKIDTCQSTVTDYDGNTYKVVKIGNQCWMAENLKVTHYADGKEIPHVKSEDAWCNLDYNDKAWCKAWYYYDNSWSKGDTCGLLYTWAAAMNGAASSNSNPSALQGVCPDGWHLPSNDEWEELEIFISNDGHSGSVGEALKAKSGWGVRYNGTDDYGFSAHKMLNRTSTGEFVPISLAGGTNWWSSTESNTGQAVYRVIYRGGGLHKDDTRKDHGLPVRCLRD
jgi:uncharacterized protein (TIGR02145 family)